MEAKTMIMGGIGMAALYGVCKTIRFLTTPVPISAEEMVKKKFDPATSPWDHPFYNDWAAVPRNKETLDLIERRFFKYLKKNLCNRKETKELDQEEHTMLFICSITDTLEKAIRNKPEEVVEALGEDYDFELDSDGKMFWDPFADPASLTDNKEKEQAAANKMKHIKNEKMLRKLIRKLSGKIVESLLYDGILAESLTKIVKGEMNVDDLSPDEVNEIFIRTYKILPSQFREYVNEASEQKFRILTV